MRYLIQIFVAFMLLVPSFCFAEDSVSALKSIFSLALKNSEKIAVSEQSVRRAEMLYKQTFGLAIPEITFRHQSTWQDQSLMNTSGMFRVSRTGLTGYRELAALRSGKLLVLQRQYETQRVKQLLFSDVASAFFGLLQSKENILSIEKSLALAGKRKKELEERVRIGRARDADLIEQQFQEISLQVQREENERGADNRRQLLSFLAGNEVTDPDLAGVTPDGEMPVLDQYLSKIDRRPDVQALVENVEISKTLVDNNRANYFPQWETTANLYPYQQSSREGIDWDVTLNAVLPLWSWGAREAQMDSSRSALDQSWKELGAAKRQALLELKQAYRDYASAKKQLNLQQQALELARNDYELQVRDDRRGLVTSLEVIESLNRLNSAELALNNSRLQERLSALNLEIAAGASPEEILK